MKDSSADKCIVLALIGLALSCVHPAIGFVVQFPLVLVLANRHDVKVLPALLLLMFTKGNFFLFSGESYALRLGITLTTTSLLTITIFVLTIRDLICGKYDTRTSLLACVWLMSIIPAGVMSFTAKSYGLSGIWSGPIMDFLAPSYYFWGISLGKSYLPGRRYLALRMMWLLLFLTTFGLLTIHYFSFIPSAMLFCLSLYFLKTRELSRFRWMAPWGIVFSILAAVIGGYLIKMYGSSAVEDGLEITSADKMGSSFTAVATLIGAIGLGAALKRRAVLGIAHLIPIVMVVVNIIFVSSIINIQGGNEARDVTFKYETLKERMNWKLFGDRGAVWTMGWEEMKTPPYLFRDLRQQIEMTLIGPKMRILPHNQFLTLLARRGWWLGLTLSLFIIVIQVRAFGALRRLWRDSFISGVIVPVGGAIFFVVGVTGQSVITGDLWGNALATMVLLGVVHKQWLDSLRGDVWRCGYSGSIVA